MQIRPQREIVTGHDGTFPEPARRLVAEGCGIEDEPVASLLLFWRQP